jgi:hypothetical protein
VEDVSSESGDQLCEDLSSTSLLYSAPSCIQDFTERWITEVMRQYYMTQFGHKSPLPQGIGSFSVEMAGNNDIKGEQDEDGQVRDPQPPFAFSKCRYLPSYKKCPLIEVWHVATRSLSSPIHPTLMPLQTKVLIASSVACSNFTWSGTEGGVPHGTILSVLL